MPENEQKTGDQDNNVSFQSDPDDDMDTAGAEEEDWIEYIKRSTRDAEDKMRAANIPCWTEAQWKMKWRLAMRIASHSEARWNKKPQDGTLDSAPRREQAEVLEDQVRDGMTTSTNSSDRTKLKKHEGMT